MINKLSILLLMVLAFAGLGEAQEIAGDWEGMLVVGPAQLRLVLHVTGDAASGYRGTFDSPDQNSLGMQVETISLEGSKLIFTLPAVGGSFEGTVHESGASIVGLWTQQGNSLPLELTQRPAGQAAAERIPAPGAMDGAWSGSVPVDGQSIELIAHITTYQDGLGGTLDIPALNAQGLPITTLTRDERGIRLEMRQLAANFEGTLSEDGSSISGTWRQPGYESPLVLRRVAGGQ